MILIFGSSFILFIFPNIKRLSLYNNELGKVLSYSKSGKETHLFSIKLYFSTFLDLKPDIE